jgi:hypothetical protein
MKQRLNVAATQALQDITLKKMALLWPALTLANASID